MTILDIIGIHCDIIEIVAEKNPKYILWMWRYEIEVILSMRDGFGDFSVFWVWRKELFRGANRCLMIYSVLVMDICSLLCELTRQKSFSFNLWCFGSQKKPQFSRNPSHTPVNCSKTASAKPSWALFHNFVPFKRKSPLILFSLTKLCKHCLSNCLRNFPSPPPSPPPF